MSMGKRIILSFLKQGSTENMVIDLYSEINRNQMQTE